MLQLRRATQADSLFLYLCNNDRGTREVSRRTGDITPRGAPALALREAGRPRLRALSHRGLRRTRRESSPPADRDHLRR